MPQGRSKAFSGKKKKLQMQEKRSRTAKEKVIGEIPSYVPEDNGGVGSSSVIVGAAAADRRTLLSEDTVNLGARSGTGREMNFDCTLGLRDAYISEAICEGVSWCRLKLLLFLSGRNSTCDFEKRPRRN